VIAVDTNVLVYAHRLDSPFQQRAAEALRTLAEGRSAWAIPWPCLHEFYAVVTHPRVYQPPTSPAVALATIDAWLESPSLQVLHEASDHWAVLSALLKKGGVAGPRVHDARIAAICLCNGVREVWSADRDFTRFAKLVVHNPLVD
jgi:toxin-antitoxin system PIN domain toxin